MSSSFIIVLLITTLVYGQLQPPTIIDGEDWTVPSWVEYTSNSGFFSEEGRSGLINVKVFDLAWKQLNPSEGVYVTNLSASIKANMDGGPLVFDTFDQQNTTKNPFWMRIWSSAIDWAPSYIGSKCNVVAAGTDYDGDAHYPIWNPCVWGEIKKLYRYFFITKGMRSDPRLKFIYVPGAFNWCEFDFGEFTHNPANKPTFAEFNSWFQTAMQDLVDIFNGENTDPNDDYAYKLVFTGEDYPFDLEESWPHPQADLFARDATLKGMGIRTGITELFNFHLSDIPSYGIRVDQNGYMVLNKTYPLQANPKRIIATENECYNACGYSVNQSNLFYAIKMSNLKALQMGVNWLYVVYTDSYMAQYPPHWSWVRYSLGKTSTDTFEAWVALRAAQDTFWVDYDYITWKGVPYVKNYERYLIQRDIPGAYTKNGSTKKEKILGTENGIAYEGRSTNIANGNSTIAFWLDSDYKASLANTQTIQIKVTYLGKAASSFVISHSPASGGSPINSPAVQVQSNNAVKTATFTFNNQIRFKGQLIGGSDFEIKSTGTADIEIQFVRVVSSTKPTSTPPPIPPPPSSESPNSKITDQTPSPNNSSKLVVSWIFVITLLLIVILY
eukprot:gene10784-13205_t